MKQEDCELEASPGYIANPCLLRKNNNKIYKLLTTDLKEFNYNVPS
jgi:hypothetical protein